MRTPGLPAVLALVLAPTLLGACAASHERSPAADPSLPGNDEGESGTDSGLDSGPGPGPEGGSDADCLPVGRDVLNAYISLGEQGWSGGDPTGVRVLVGSLQIGEGYGVAPGDLSALRCLHEVVGDLRIGGTNNLTDLSSLSGLRVLQGDLSIQDNVELRSLGGLENLEMVPGETPLGPGSESKYVNIGGNPQLANVDAILGLDDVRIDMTNNSRIETLPRFDWEHVVVSLYNNALKDLAGLRGVTRLLGFSVDEPALATLQDLSALEAADTLSLNGVPDPDLGALAKLRDVRVLEVRDGSNAFGVEGPLVSLHGLEGLTILEDLTIASDSLKSMAGLSGVVEVSGRFSISGANLESLAGLDSLRHMTGTLALSRIPGATNMPGLERLETVGGLSITLLSQDDEGAAGLPVFRLLTYVEGDVMLYGNRNLNDLRNLGALEYIAGTLIIDQNHALTDLRGLSALQHIDGDLAIGFNDRLQSLDGLAPDVELRGRLLVIGNDSLPTTSAEALAESTGRDCACDVYWPETCVRCDAPCACVAEALP